MIAKQLSEFPILFRTPPRGSGQIGSEFPILFPIPSAKESSCAHCETDLLPSLWTPCSYVFFVFYIHS
jgi:hypothetical protein